MEQENNKTWLVIFLIIISIWFWQDHNKLTQEVTSLQGEVDDLDYRISLYADALERANSNIEEANSIIDDAQTYTWSSYEKMGEALDNLIMADTVPEP